MKPSFSRSAAFASVAGAIVFRVFWGAMVEYDGLMNGLWLSTLMGAALSVPLVLFMGRLRNRAAPLAPLFLILLIPDAAATMECVAFSESYLASNHTDILILMLPLTLAALRCATIGGNAIGAAARVGARVLAGLLIVVVLCQLPAYRPAWLFPLLGSGPRSLLASAFRSAGWMTAIAGAALLLCDGRPRTGRIIACMVGASTVAAALIGLRLMMTPAVGIAGLTRMVRLDSLLTNGRASLETQLPMIVIWFTGMLHLLCFECWLCGSLLKRCFPIAPQFLCHVLIVAGVFALAASRGYPIRWLTDMPEMRYILMAIAALPGLWAKDRKGGCEKCPS